MDTLHLKLGINQLRCHYKPEKWVEAEPYMWNVFFKIDGSCVNLDETFRLHGRPVYHFSEGSHGNLKAKGIMTGDAVGIPKEVGEWKTSLEPIDVPYFEGSISGLIGVVCVLMEQNYVSSKGAEAGHQALNEYVIEAIDASIRGFDPKRVDIHDVDLSVKKYFDAQVVHFSDRIGNLVGEAVANAQSIVQNILSLVRKDVVVGYRVFDLSSAGIMAADGEISFNHRWDSKKFGDWEVRGRVVARKDEERKNALRKRKKKDEEE